MIETLLDRLDVARSRLRLMRLATGALFILAAFITAAFGWFLCDWVFVHRILEGGLWDTGLRLLLVVGVLSVTGRVAWLTFIAEWRIERSDDELAVRVERTHRALGGRLISSVQLARVGDSGSSAMAPDLIEALIEATVSEADAFDFHAIIDVRELKRAALWALIPILVVGALSAWKPGYAITALKRLVLLSAEYPTATRILTVVPHPLDGVLIQPQGEALSFTVTLDAEGFLPDEVEMAIKPKNGRSSSVRLKRDEQRPALYTGTLSQVLDDLEFRPYAFDARWPVWIPVKAQRRPSLKSMVATVTTPAYLDEPAETNPFTDMTVPVGTVVTLSATFADPVVTAQAEIITGAGEPVLVPFTMDAAQLTAKIDLPVTATTSIRVLLLDNHAFTNPDPVSTTITAVPDMPPMVALTYPRRDVAATKFARWPLRFSVKDDHGLGKAVIRWQLEDATGEPNTISIGDLGPSQTAQKEQVFELSKLDPPIGSRVLVWIEVLDRKQPEPNKGASLKRSITILDPEQLRQELEAAQNAAVEAIGTARDRQKEIKLGVDLLKNKPTQGTAP